MATTYSELENILNTHLQKNILITIGGIEVKRGKFLLYQNNILANNFNYDLTIERIKKIDIFRLPYPFKIEYYAEDGLLYLDYRFSSLTEDKKHLTRIDTLKDKYAEMKLSKFLDRIVEIEFT